MKLELDRLNPDEHDAVGCIRRESQVGILQNLQIEAVEFGELQILVGPEDCTSEDVGQPASDLGAALSVDVERSVGRVVSEDDFEGGIPVGPFEMSLQIVAFPPPRNVPRGTARVETSR